ncbi:MAG: endonuclease/exonuclease/phosphatase family protein [Parvularculaceae bacterium]
MTFSKIAGRFLIIAAALAAVWLVTTIGVNRMSRNVVLEALGPVAAMRSLEGDSLSVTIWNLGYAGLGAESDFSVDGGKNYLPPSRAVTAKNIAGISRELAATNADVVLLQETARASLLTRGADSVAAAATSLAGRDNAFSADFATRLMPPPFAARHGLLSSVGVGGATREIVMLPLEPQFILGMTQRLYHLHVIRLPAPGGDWTVVDLHLSAFDEGANVRLEQLRAVLKFAQAEYAKGNRVVLGGDWNYEFHRPQRPTTTEEKYLFWVHPFPYDELPEGWSVAIDRDTPSVRTNERPYVKGENFTTVIDGFVLSPNVKAESVKTRDLDFQFSDHQPVDARFVAVK